MRASRALVIAGASLTLGGMAIGAQIDDVVLRACLAFGVPMMVLGVCLGDDPL